MIFFAVAGGAEAAWNHPETLQIMSTCRFLCCRILAAGALVVLAAATLSAGVSRAIQERYRQKYENQALYLRIPVYADRQYVFISGGTFRPEQSPTAAVPRFKVADQVRIVGIDFGGDEIKFKISGIGSAAASELIFRFDSELQENFPNSGVFDSALEAVLSEGLKYTDLEDAKRENAQKQFTEAVTEIAASSGASREAVLQFIAPQVPAYRDAEREIDSLKKRNQELAAQIDRLQAENRTLSSDLRTQQNEVAQLRTLSASLQDRIDSTTSQLTRIREDLGRAQGERAGYQKELASLQRSLRLRAEAGRDLPSQISEIAQATQRLQQEKQALENQGASLKAELERQTQVNTKLSGEVEDLNANVKKMRETIGALTSKEDSLARQYLDLKQVNENLENIKLAVANLRTRVVEESSADGKRQGKVDVYLADIRLGTIEYALPEYVEPDGSARAEARFAAESVDYVRVAPAERRILQSLGERLKIQMSLASSSGGMEITPEASAALQQIGERDSGTWRWRIRNQGRQDARLALAAALVNRNSDEIPLWQNEEPALSASIVRQVRGYLQPIPLGVGALIGFLLFGIAGVFRRGGRRHEPGTVVGKKGL